MRKLLAVSMAAALLIVMGWGLTLAADPAVAAPAAAPAAAADLLGSVMMLAASVLAGVLIWAVTLLARKFGIELDAGKTDALRQAATDGIYYAEEWAAKKFAVDQVAVAGSDKLKNAVGFVLAKIPGADTAEVKDAIHAVLGSIQGLGASKGVGQTPQ